MNYYNSETLLEQQQEIEKLKEQNAALIAERDALTAQVEALGDKLSEVVALLDVDGMTAVQWLLDNCQEIESLTNMEPQQHLAEIRADTAEKFYYMGWEHSLSTKSDDGDHYGCGKRLAKSFADSVRRGGVE